jgi:putative ABC transport system permease protein
VDRTFVRKVLGGGSALGKRIRYVTVADDDDERAGAARPKRWYEIVGVVEDLRVNALDPEAVPASVYYPVAPGQTRGASLAVRLRGAVSPAFSVRLREITTALDPTLRLGEVRSLADADRRQRLAARLAVLAVCLVMLSVFLLSAAGVYALMSFTVTQRRREIGIRTALGAHPRQVLRSIFSRAAAQIGLGVVVGVAAAVLLEWASGGELMDGRGTVLLPILALAMTIVGLLAALGPARRGLRIQPTEALRAEL